MLCAPHPLSLFPKWSLLTGELNSSSTEKASTSRSSAAFRRKLFNRIAPNYDQLNDLLSLGQHRIWKRMAVSWSGAKDGDIVLDICCGSGDLTFLLSETVGLSGKVIGLDFANEQLMLAAQRQTNSTNPCHSNIQWRQGDALNLPFEDFYFSALTCGYGLRNILDITEALREMLRVLKQGSSVSILDFNRSLSNTTASIQDWLLENLVVPVASIYGLRDEYAYLKSSITHFPSGNAQEKIARKVGFSNARHYEIAGGLMGVLVATR
eukprot:TRINITY_DN17782_c0_g1_i1.p1 TRINITY_DN17782_c0_g1~~TRINITY_DN17782_c0_g1_i1.p1  ORF type:complete len:266 (-),score=41.69 TRINITY_DN17782_c0_g1_i1:167-964(-)